jgi:hypothetical protein
MEKNANTEHAVTTTAGTQDEPYGYAPIHPNGNYFTRNKSTAEYVGGMMPVYARAASSATAPLTSDSDSNWEREFHEAAMAYRAAPIMQAPDAFEQLLRLARAQSTNGEQS